MSQYPYQDPAGGGPGVPLGYAQPSYGPPVNPRPTSITVLAIIGIILGGLGTLCTPVSLIQMFGGLNFGQPNPVLDAMRQNTALFAASVGQTVLSWAVAIMFLSASIGSLSLKTWARGLMNATMIIYLAMLLVNTVLQVLWTMPMVQQALASQPKSVRDMVQMWMTIGVFGGLLFWGVVCALYLIFYNRPRAVAAFRGEAFG